MTVPSELDRWFGRTLAVVGLVTAARLLLLAFNKTDLFVDESQYWLWGQHLDFGYYSKPPLIAWVIRAVTGLAGSDAAFWVRMPGAVLHAGTAMVLAAAGARIAGGRAAFWVGVSYVTVPFATVGSLLISTDSVMAPAFAAALYCWICLAQTRQAKWALGAGVAIGMAFLAKYAAIYFLFGAGLAAIWVPQMRVGLRMVLLMLAAFALVIAPNVIWNLTHDLTTVGHTMDNVGWVRQKSPLAGVSPVRALWFLLGQFLVFGPVLMAGLLWGLGAAWRQAGTGRALLLFMAVPLLVVFGQALMGKAYANWAVASYFAGILLVVPALLRASPGLLRLSMVVNGFVALALPVLTLLAPWPERDGAALLKRYLGQEALSAALIEAARANGAVAIYSEDRATLAGLYYYGAGSGLRFYAPRPQGKPQNYYEQMFALPNAPGKVLYDLGQPPVCGGGTVAPVATLSRPENPSETHALYLVPEGCSDDRF